MSRYAVIRKATGEVLRSGPYSGTEVPEMALDATEETVAADGDAAGDTHWYDGAGFQPYSIAGARAKQQRMPAGFDWHPAAESWVDQRPLEAVRAALLSRLRDKRDALIFGGLTWDGSVFDSDAEISQPRMLGAFTSALAGAWPPEGVAWRLRDNTWRVLSAADVQSIWAALQARIQALFAAFAAHEAAVNAETSIGALRTYDVEAGWP